MHRDIGCANRCLSSKSSLDSLAMAAYGLDSLVMGCLERAACEGSSRGSVGNLAFLRAFAVSWVRAIVLTCVQTRE